jgi:nitroreductase
MNSIFHRVSIRKYQEKPVEEEKIELLLKAGMQAPSACNQQPWEFYVVTDKETIQKLSGSTPYAGAAKGAPLVIVPCDRKNGLMAPSLADVDLAICTENILLEADELGLGAVMMAVAPDKERMDAVRRICDIPSRLDPFCLIPVGYPAEGHPQQNRYDTSRIHRI